MRTLSSSVRKTIFRLSSCALSKPHHASEPTFHSRRYVHLSQSTLDWPG